MNSKYSTIVRVGNNYRGSNINPLLTTSLSDRVTNTLIWVLNVLLILSTINYTIKLHNVIGVQAITDTECNGNIYSRYCGA